MMDSQWRKDSWGNGSAEIEWNLGNKLGGYCIAQARGNSDFHYIIESREGERWLEDGYDLKEQ